MPMMAAKVIGGRQTGALKSPGVAVINRQIFVLGTNCVRIPTSVVGIWDSKVFTVVPIIAILNMRGPEGYMYING